MFIVIANPYSGTLKGNFRWLEFLWTLFPGVLLINIGLNSGIILYFVERISDPDLTVKVTGHQWYWTYEYCDFENVVFDSYMLPEEEIIMGDFRLFEVDNRLVLPILVNIRLVVTSDDVIHSFAVPSLGLKVDAVPGLLNVINTKIVTPGLYMGQCIEICGPYHRFMPIIIEATTPELFRSWLLSH